MENLYLLLILCGVVGGSVVVLLLPTYFVDFVSSSSTTILGETQKENQIAQNVDDDDFAALDELDDLEDGIVMMEFGKLLLVSGERVEKGLHFDDCRLLLNLL